MRRTEWIVAAALLACGCDKPAAKTARTAPAAPQSVAESPSAFDAQPASAAQPQKPATQPANAFLTIDGRIMEFPPARLRLSKTDEGVTALLFSDDPRSATSANYKGNSFYFDLPLRISDPSEIDGGEYAYKADESEPSESPNGIFLSGTRYHLQPQNVAVRFDADGKKVMAQVSGRFLVVRTTEQTLPGQTAVVQGTLYTTAEVEK